MMVDTDVVFTLPVTCSSLFDRQGRPYMLYWDFGAQPQFVQPCEDMIGGCVGSFMAFFPMILPVSMFVPDARACHQPPLTCLQHLSA